MLTRVCFRHNRVGEYDVWRDEPKMAEFMLYLKKPVLCTKCDVCIQEDSLKETIKLLRQQEEP